MSRIGSGVWGEILLPILHVKSGDQNRSMIWSVSIGRRIYTNKYVSNYVGVWGEILLRILHVKSSDQTRTKKHVSNLAKFFSQYSMSNLVTQLDP